MTAAQQQIAGYGKAAALYRRAGWDGVLPLPKDKKTAPPDGYTGYDGAFPDGKQIYAWTVANPHGNLALRMPRGVVGLDVDRYGSKRGDETLAELEARYGILPPTWSSTSRGPGPSRIHLFRCPEELKLPGIPGPSIEAIQYHHRYVVAWPSVVEGRLYEWYDADGVPRTRPPKINELTWLPEDWHRVEKRARPALEDYQPRAVDGDWSKAVVKYHGEGVAGLGNPGGRHDAMLPVIMSLVRLDHDGHPGSAEALDDLRCRFVLTVQDRSSSTEAENEWQRMEDGAEAQVSSTPSLRGSYEDLKAKAREQHPSSPPKAQTAPSAPVVEDEEPEPEVEGDLGGWKYVEPWQYLNGTHTRPQPAFLRRK